MISSIPKFSLHNFEKVPDISQPLLVTSSQDENLVAVNEFVSSSAGLTALSLVGRQVLKGGLLVNAPLTLGASIALQTGVQVVLLSLEGKEINLSDILLNSTINTLMMGAGMVVFGAAGGISQSLAKQYGLTPLKAAFLRGGITGLANSAFCGIGNLLGEDESNNTNGAWALSWGFLGGMAEQAVLGRKGATFLLAAINIARNFGEDAGGEYLKKGHVTTADLIRVTGNSFRDGFSAVAGNQIVQKNPQIIENLEGWANKHPLATRVIGSTAGAAFLMLGFQGSEHLMMAATGLPLGRVPRLRNEKVLARFLANEDFLEMLPPEVYGFFSPRSNREDLVQQNIDLVVTRFLKAFHDCNDPEYLEKVMAHPTHLARFIGVLLTRYLQKEDLKFCQSESVSAVVKPVLAPSAIVSSYASDRISGSDVRKQTNRLLRKLTEESIYRAVNQRGEIDVQKIVNRNIIMGIVIPDGKTDFSVSMTKTLFARAPDEWEWIYSRLLPSIPGGEIRVKNYAIGHVLLPKGGTGLPHPYTYEPFLWVAGDKRVLVEIGEINPQVIRAIEEFDGTLQISCPWFIKRLPAEFQPKVQVYIQKVFQGHMPYLERVGSFYQRFVRGATQTSGSKPVAMFPDGDTIVPLIGVPVDAEVRNRIVVPSGPEDIFTAPMERRDYSVIHAHTQHWGSEAEDVVSIGFLARAVDALRDDGHGYYLTHHPSFPTTDHGTWLFNHAPSPALAKALGLEVVRDGLLDDPPVPNLIFRKVGPSNNLVKTLANRAKEGLARWKN